MALISFSPVRFLFTRKSLYFPAFALIGAAAFLTGCQQRVTDPNDPKFIVAEKNDWVITKGELDTEVAAFMKERQITPEQVGAAKMPILQTAELKNMVLQKLLLDKGKSMNLPDVDADTAKALEGAKASAPTPADYQAKLKEAGLTEDELKKRIHDQIVVNKVLKAEAIKDVEPSEQEINALYMQARDRYFTHPPKIRASRVLIMVDDHTSPADKATKKKAIDKAHDRVAHGEDFSKVATEVSEDHYSAPKGGDIGAFQKGENEPEFDAVAFNSKVGELSPVFQTPLGYQFLKVTEQQPGGVVSEAEARPTITSFLKQQKQQGQVEAYTTDLLKNSGVTFHFKLMDLPEASAPNGGAPQEGGAPGAPAGAAPAADAAPAAAPAPAATNGPSH